MFLYGFSLVKMVCESATKAEQGGQISDEDLVQSIRRNFSGLDDLDPVEIFSRQFPRLQRFLKASYLIFEKLTHLKYICHPR